MVENINVALAPLKKILASNDKIPVIPEVVLEQRFHGLDLHQLVQLTSAPALAVTSKGRAPDGGEFERFAVDGNDEQRCGAVARQLLLDAAAPVHPGDIREVLLSNGDGLEQTLLRDHNDVVYRVLGGHAAIDQELTDLLRQRRASRSGAGPFDPSTVVDEGETRARMLEDMREAVATLRECNRTGQRTIEELIAGSGQRDLMKAVAATDPEVLAASLQQIVMASAQVDRLAHAIAGRLEAVLTQPTSREAPVPPRVSAPPPREMPSEQPDEAELIHFPHEPF